MSVKSSKFGAVRLTEEDARKFKNQFQFARPNATAVAACARGKDSAKKFVKQGYAVLKSTG